MGVYPAFNDNMGGDRARCRIAFSVAVGLLIGLPIWWKTTEVYRAPLPQLNLNEAANNPLLRLHTSLDVVILTSTTNDLINTDIESQFQVLERFERALRTDRFSAVNGTGDRNHQQVEQDIAVSLIYVDPVSCLECSQFLEAYRQESCELRWKVSSEVWASLSSHEQDQVLLPLAARQDAYTIFLIIEESGHPVNSEEDSKEVTDGSLPSQSQEKLAPPFLIGKHSHAWITVPAHALAESSSETVVPKVVEVARQMIQGATAISVHKSKSESVSGSKRLSKSESKESKGPRRHRARSSSAPMPLAADGSALLSFSLLNAEPIDWIFDWDFAAVEKEFLAPMVRTISPVADLAVESQVLYYAPGQVRPKWEPQHQAYTLSHSALPFFVNSHEWHLDSSVAAAGRSKLLHLVVYVPSAHECPLRFKLPNGKLSPTDGFTVPSWGGVVVWNPPGCARYDSPSRIPPDEMRRILAVQIGQIRTLFGLPAAPKQLANMHTLSPGPNGFVGCDLWGFEGLDVGFNSFRASKVRETSCHQLSGVLVPEGSRKNFEEVLANLYREVAALLRKRAAEDSQEVLSTLGSLSKLVSELSNMVVQDSIADQVKRALTALDKARKEMLAGSNQAAAMAARNARAQAEAAFFHPTLMSLLYFPSEHHMAIYMPLFLPVLLNVCAASFRETLRWGRTSSKQRLDGALSRVKQKRT